MKKILSLILALSLLSGCGAAFSEAAEKTEMGTLEVVGAFTLKCAMPEGYKLEVIKQTNDTIIALLLPEDLKKPMVTISIAYDDEYSNIERMNDLPEEQLRVIEDSFAQMDDIKVEYGETGLGTKLMIVTENDDDGETDFVDIYTIYKGFGTEFVMTRQEHEGVEEDDLTQREIQMLIDFITGIDFVDKAPYVK